MAYLVFHTVNQQSRKIFVSCACGFQIESDKALKQLAIPGLLVYGKQADIPKSLESDIRWLLVVVVGGEGKIKETYLTDGAFLQSRPHLFLQQNVPKLYRECFLRGCHSVSFSPHYQPIF
ncbi:hypothetical protein [Oscillatoria nigro-viridis]|uniref:hypothetical protein n=1 Tax=Phormidium nigroviride TaxID=482564 RepID=UPI0005A0164C|nr:hypothetical protein [Oscillatoria nigro-viridis]